MTKGEAIDDLIKEIRRVIIEGKSRVVKLAISRALEVRLEQEVRCWFTNTDPHIAVNKLNGIPYEVSEQLEGFNFIGYDKNDRIVCISAPA